MGRYVWVLLCAWLYGYSANAATVKRVSLGDLKALSEFVVIGSVASLLVESDSKTKQVWTRITVEVSEVIKGEAPSVLEFKQLGGQIPGSALVYSVHGLPEFFEGENVLLFLERADSGRLVVAGMAQGKYTLTKIAGHEGLWARRDTSDLAFVGDKAPIRSFSFAPRSIDSLPLNTLRTLLLKGLGAHSPLHISGPRTSRVREPSRVATP